MTDLELALSGLGLSQYLDCLVQVGFDSWETLMEITEQDLESLNVKLGHRRKLQRQIANSRGLTERLSSHQHHHPLAIPISSSSSTGGSSGQCAAATGDGAWPAQSPSGAPIVAPKKRAYVHHPKPDTNAPARPYSAYVLFSKAVREDLQCQPLSFTQISKEVGERWQRLTPEEKRGWRLQSALPWRQYRTDLAKYRLSDDYQHYRQYLSKFTSAQVARRGGDPSPHMNAAAMSSPKERSKRLAISPGTITPPLWGSSASNGVEEERAPGPRAVNHGVIPSPPRSRPRAVHTCESCRRRKVKCDGERSGCGKCRHLNSTCSLTVSTRDDQKRIENSLWFKLNAYETMLYGLIPRVGDEDRAAIASVLLTPLPIKKEAFPQKESKPNGDTNGDSGDNADGDADGDVDGDVDGDTDADADDETTSEAAQMSWITSSRPLRDENGVDKTGRVGISEFSRHPDQYPSPHSLGDQFTEDQMSSSGTTFSPILSPGSASMWPQRRRQEQFPDSFLQQLEKVQQQQQQQHDDEPYYPDTIFDKITTTTIAVDPDEFRFLQHDDPSVMDFYPASIASAKNTLPGQEENLMMLSH